MLTLKMGVAIHADYTFRVISDDPVRNVGPYLFVNNELTMDGLSQHSKDLVIGNALFGTSNQVDAAFSGVMVPVFKQSIANVLPTNTISNDSTAKTTTIKSTIVFNVAGINTSEDSVLTIREFGIENYNRLVIEDPFQNLEGLLIGKGDRIEVTVDFNYTYYTNNKIGTVGEDVFGERVDYTSEIVKTRDKSLQTIRQNPGYASDNPIDVFPITKDIRGVASSMIDFPIRDVFQQEKNLLDDKVHRLDAEIIGYYENKTMVYGFILRDNLRGMVTLARFLKPVSFDPERRYRVGGYIQWSRTVDDLDEGFSTVELDTVSESVPITVESEGTIAVVPPLPDVAIEITTLKSLRLLLDRLGVVANFPNDLTWASAMESLVGTGLFEEVELLANRVGSRKASLFQYNPPDSKIHSASVAYLKGKIGAQKVIFPSLIAGGDYSNTSISNKWRWDCYFPYFGALADVSYIPYGFAAFADSHGTINALPTSIKDHETLTKYTRTGDGAISLMEYTGKQLLESRVMAEMIPGLVSYSLHSVESANSKQTIGTMVSDFDTPVYDDWVEGTSEVTVNLRTLDLRTEVVSDNRKDVTEFKITVDPARHKVENSQLWISGVNYGRLDQILPATLALVGIRLVKTLDGLKTIYTFTRPYAAGLDPYLDLYLIGNENIFSNGKEVGYLTLTTGSHGFKVYNSTGADVSNSLYPQENPFLMAGIKLFQPTPDYIFKYLNLTAQQARVYFNDPAITTSLVPRLFTTGFVDSIYSVGYNDSISWKSELLNGPQLYPAIGVDLSRIGDNIPDTEVLVTDKSGKQWTKAQLLASRTDTPNRVIGDVLYFVTPFALVAGNQLLTDQLVSAYYEQQIDLQANIIVALTYPLETATISPNPINLIIGRTAQAVYTYEPIQATITAAVWSTLNEAVATVNEFGLVTGVTPGTTTLRLVLNERVIATAVINVSDAELDITCDGAVNITTCLDIEGTQLGLNINDISILNSTTTTGIYQYFRDNDDFRIVNCSEYSKPVAAPVSETNFMDINGLHDLWIGGSLIAKNLTEAEIIAHLEADGRFVIFDGEDNV